MKKATYLLTIALFLLLSSCNAVKDAKTFLYIGSYTNAGLHDGIYVYAFDDNDGSLTEVQRVKAVNPSYLSITPNCKFLYACSETQLDTNGNISAYAIDTSTGKISFLNKQDAGGRNPVYVSTDRFGQFVLAANYTDAGVTSFPIQDNGELSAAATHLQAFGNSIYKGRQEEAHMHSIQVDPKNEFVFAPDLGSDLVRAYQLKKDGQLLEMDSLSIATKPGSGPRHFAFHPSQPYVYLATELDGQVTAYSYKKGLWSFIESYDCYENTHAEYRTADIHISPDGQYLYVSNRDKENNLAIFKIEDQNGKLKWVGHSSTFGEIPRNFVISPSGKWLLVANKTSGNIVVLKRDLESGLLKKTATEIKVSMPSCLQFATW